MVDVILIEARPRGAGDGQPVTVRLAGGGADRPYHYGGEHWRGGITGLPRSVSTLDFNGSELGGGGVPSAMQIAWQPASRRALADLAALYWIDAPVTVRIGPEGDALPPVETAGVVLAASADDGSVKLVLADAAADLKRPLLIDHFAGTGGVEGPEEWGGRVKRRAWGRCFNVRGDLIDKVANVWCFGDPGRPWRAIDAIRERGIAADPVHALAWQGSAAATYAALRDAVAPEGGCVVCPSIACVKWWTRPTGDLYVDLRGEIGDGYVETAPEIVARIVAARSALTFAPGEVAGAAAARPAPIGHLVGDDTSTAAGAVSDLLGQVSLSWVIESGQIAFRRWEWSAPVRVARSHRVERQQVMRPVGTRRLGYRRNWMPMSKSDIAASVLAKDVVYEDGTPIEEWKPADKGATRGAPEDTLVAGRPAQAIVAGVDIVADAVLEQIVRMDDLADTMQARTWVEGAALGPQYLTFRRSQEEKNAGFTYDLNLIGYRTTNGLGWVLNLSSIKVDEDGKTLTLHLEEVAARSVDSNATVTILKEALVTPDGSKSRAVIRADADGTYGAFEVSADGVTRLSRITMVMDEFEMVDRNRRGQPVKVMYYDGEKFVIDAAVHAQKFVQDGIGPVELQRASAGKTSFRTVDATVACPLNSATTVVSYDIYKEDADSVLKLQMFAQCYHADDLDFTGAFVIDGVAREPARVRMPFDNANSRGEVPITPTAYVTGISKGKHTVAWRLTSLDTEGPTYVRAGSTLEVTELRKASVSDSSGSGAPIATGPGGPSGDWGGGQFAQVNAQ